MANEINLTTLHEAIKTALAAQFPSVTVDYYNRPGVKVPAPAIFFELESIDPATPSDMGTEQLEVLLTFSANVICTYKAGQKLAVRLLAANLAKFVHKNKFGQAVTPGIFTGSVMESFSAPEDEYESWRVSWTHTALLGVSYWESFTDGDVSEAPNGGVPQSLMLGFSPDIGPAHINDYVEVQQLPDFTQP